MCGKMNGHGFLQTLVKYAGHWRLYLNTPMRKAAGINVGDIALFDIEFDPVERTIAMHPKLLFAFAKNKPAKTTFDKLPPYRQKEILRYTANLKTDASVQKNVAKIIEHLLGK